jgi:dipeptidyl aminopeptidase/acylaminoacyl peptidase
VSRSVRVLAGFTLFLLVLTISGSLSAQSKKVLGFSDSDVWRTASTPVLSPDGVYVAYAVWPGEGDGESIVRNIGTGKEYKFPRGGGVAAVAPKFTPDGKRVLLSLTLTKAEVDKAKADKAKGEDSSSQSTLTVVELATGQVTDSFPQSGPFLSGGEGQGYVVYRKPVRREPSKEKDEEKTAPAGPMGGKGKGQFAKGGGGFAKGPGAAGAAETYGTDLLIRDLATKYERVIPDVTQFSLSKDGQALVYIVASRKTETNGVYSVNPRSGGSSAAIKVGPGKYANLTWDEKQTKLAFLYDSSSVPKDNLAPPPRPKGTPLSAAATAVPAPTGPPQWRAFVWDRNAKNAASAAFKLPIGAKDGFAALLPAVLAATAPSVALADEVLGPGTPGQRSGWGLTSGSLNFSPDGTRLYVNTAPQRPPVPVAGPTGADDFQLDLWHWRDARLQPMQKLQAAADQAKTYSAVILLDNKQFRQLSDDSITVGTPPLGSDWAIGSDDRKYVSTTGYGLPLRDYSAVNVRTGEAKAILPGFGGYSTPMPSLSPTGKHLLGFDGKDWFTLSLPDGKKVNLTANLKEKFWDEEDDHPGTPPPAAAPQWTTDGKFVLVNDRYDLWKLAADGSSAENLTKIGRAQQIHFSLTRVPTGDDQEPVRGVDLSKPHLLSAENLQTRDTGFYRLEPGAASPKLLVMGARRYGQPIRAKNADVYLLTMQTFYDYPDYFATNGDFHELKRVTNTNPTIRDYNWGKAELVSYKSADGKPLSGILVKPENFNPNKKYPLVIYIYERLSQGLHAFHVPSVTRGQVINPTFYASNGYLVLMPDIAYKIGMPGQSAIKCVLPAIQAVVDKGYVDEAAIGINGQSWGGYQIAYMVTQTDRFKAAVAGAPVANMVSAYDGIRWGSGLTRQFQYEWSQSRIGSTLWEAPLKYIENSPVFMADRVKTPLLMIANDQDDAVPWYQGIEYYLALRRLGKECYMLNYNGEPHNLAKRAAARDFAARMFQFFEHHLKGKPEPAWMAKGVPYLDRDKEKEELKKLYQPEKK